MVHMVIIFPCISMISCFTKRVLDHKMEYTPFSSHAISKSRLQGETDRLQVQQMLLEDCTTCNKQLDNLIQFHHRQLVMAEVLWVQTSEKSLKRMEHCGIFGTSTATSPARHHRLGNWRRLWSKSMERREGLHQYELMPCSASHVC